MDANFLKLLKSKCKELEIPFQGVPPIKLNKITNQNHQGVVLILSEIKYYKVEDILSQVYESGELPLFVILDGVTDIHNMGAIARTAWATGAHAIIVPHKGSASINAEAIKKSAGALMHIPVCRAINLKESVNFLKNSGLNIVSLGLEKESKWLHQLEAKQPLAIIMGSEGKGVTEKSLLISDEIIKIPMVNSFDSYNVSVAAAMVLYETMKQRMNIEL
ncbi:UNVERIFIED_CONTAM: hypothetical protein GTU68_039527 [Idotea baltica]|nr:hypothetical protein [Idotea baltica]